jgi:hypothetical protein
MPPITQETSTSEVATLTPMRVPFCEIHEPGAYGHLVRIPEDAVKPARTPVIDLVANQPLVFTKISDNPFLAINKARMLACDLDLPVQF